ncbi:MAG TPA: hypothetical protein VFE65_08170 [Pseudonocardia sp.]|nr:hypothetical protein [Pseudonocardia sp.]
MSAPTVESVVRARAARTAGTSVPGQQPSPSRSGAAVDKAYARRAGRRERSEGAVSPESEGRSQFVLLIMVLLGVGLIASLWLSTTAAADSYRLDAARQSTRALSERIEIVHSQIAAMQSAPALARAARSLGMVQQTEVARLVVAPDGQVTVFGTPKAAVAPVAPSVAVPAPTLPQASQPASQPGQSAPGTGQPGVQPGQAVPQPGQAVQPAQPGQPAQPSGPGQVVLPGQPVPGPSDVVRAGEVRPEHVP